MAATDVKMHYFDNLNFQIACDWFVKNVPKIIYLLHNFEFWFSIRNVNVKRSSMKIIHAACSWLMSVRDLDRLLCTSTPSQVDCCMADQLSASRLIGCCSGLKLSVSVDALPGSAHQQQSHVAQCDFPRSFATLAVQTVLRIHDNRVLPDGLHMSTCCLGKLLCRSRLVAGC